MTSISIPSKTIKVGYGFILEDQLFNVVRLYELDIFQSLGVHQGLRQPPHITIKRPFTIDSENIPSHKKLLHEFATHTRKLNVSYGPVKWFGNDTAYIAINSDAVHGAHNSLLKMLEKQGIEKGDFEGADFTAHTTLALEFGSRGLDEVRKSIDSQTLLQGTAIIDTVGLFLNIDDSHWIIVATEKLTD